MDKSWLRTPRNITELLNYRMASLLAASGASVIRVCEGRFGISRREWHLLGLLQAFGPQSPSDLALSCHLDRARVSKAISMLSSKKLVRRVASPGDRRRAIVELTDSGAKLHAEVFEEVSSINALLLKGICDEQLAELDGLLLQLQTTAEVVKRETAPDIHADRWKGSGARIHWPADANAPRCRSE